MDKFSRECQNEWLGKLVHEKLNIFLKNNFNMAVLWHQINIKWIQRNDQSYCLHSITMSAYDVKWLSGMYWNYVHFKEMIDIFFILFIIYRIYNFSEKYMSHNIWPLEMLMGRYTFIYTFFFCIFILSSLYLWYCNVYCIFITIMSFFLLIF